MTHPLTPREKVAQIIRDGMSRLAASQAGARPVVSASKEADRVTDAILTALASGSGDHAELARLARIWSDTSVTNHKMPGDTAVVWSRRLEALLAENAAVRESISRHDRQVSGMLRARLSAEARATEAERKLAEAVSVMDQIREAGSISKARDLARVFLSKEAERG